MKVIKKKKNFKVPFELLKPGDIFEIDESHSDFQYLVIKTNDGLRVVSLPDFELQSVNPFDDVSVILHDSKLTIYK